MMNLYECHVKDVLWQDVIDPELGGPWYRDDVYEHIFAETPGRAKAVFYKQHRRAVDYIEIRCKTILRNVNRAEGFLEFGDPLYLHLIPAEDMASFLDAYPEYQAVQL